MSDPLTVIKIPGDTEFTLIFGPTAKARDLTRWICAAFETAYAWGLVSHGYRNIDKGQNLLTIELPLGLTPATLATLIKAPFSLCSRWTLAA